jgi:putative transposase
MQPKRKKLPHGIPSWVENGADYFITICTQPRGQNQLANSSAFETIGSSLKFRQDRGELWVNLLVLMPDHLHAIMSFSPDIGIQKTITDWKRYICVRTGIQWQRDFFDHRFRKDESYVEKAHYIRMNPVRAGLIERSEDWPYVWENKR